jgi:hypothetical protein
VKKILVLIFVFLTSCSKKENIELEGSVFVDKGISVYQDNTPNNDVMMQAFWWDSFSDSRISYSGDFGSKFPIKKDDLIDILSNFYCSLIDICCSFLTNLNMLMFI